MIFKHLFYRLIIQNDGTILIIFTHKKQIYSFVTKLNTNDTNSKVSNF